MPAGVLPLSSSNQPPRSPPPRPSAGRAEAGEAPANIVRRRRSRSKIGSPLRASFSQTANQIPALIPPPPAPPAGRLLLWGLVPLGLPATTAASFQPSGSRIASALRFGRCQVGRTANLDRPRDGGGGEHPSPNPSITRLSGRRQNRHTSGASTDGRPPRRRVLPWLRPVPC